MRRELMLLVALVVLALLAWWAVHPDRIDLFRPGVALTVVGAVLSLVMPWMMFPFLLLAVGILCLVVRAVKARVRTLR